MLSQGNRGWNIIFNICMYLSPCECLSACLWVSDRAEEVLEEKNTQWYLQVSSNCTEKYIKTELKQTNQKTTFVLLWDFNKNMYLKTKGNTLYFCQGIRFPSYFFSHFSPANLSPPTAEQSFPCWCSHGYRCRKSSIIIYLSSCLLCQLLTNTESPSGVTARWCTLLQKSPAGDLKE